MAKTNQLMVPCNDCAFLRTCRPGNLGGSPSITYVGQCHGPFWIPCHCSRDYRDKQSEFGDEAECVGSAIFRANTGRIELMPAALLHLPADKELVFADNTEFVAHHEGITVEEAAEFLSLPSFTPDALLDKELHKRQARVLDTTPKE